MALRHHTAGDTHCGVEQIHLARSLLKQIDARNALCALHQGLLHAGRVQNASPPVPPARSVPVAPALTLARLALRRELALAAFLSPERLVALPDQFCMQGCSISITQGIVPSCFLQARADAVKHKCCSWCFGKARACAPQRRWRPGGRLHPPPPATPPTCPTGCGSRPVSCCPSRPARMPPHPAVNNIDPQHTQP